MYAKMLTAVMAATGLAAGYTYSAEQLDDAGDKIVSFYEVEVLTQQAEVDDLYAQVMSTLEVGR